MKRLVLLCVMVFSFVLAKAQSTIASAEDLKKWLPTTLQGYTAETDSYASELKQNGATYFMAAKKYNKGSATVSVIIFDYRGASAEIKKVTDSWNPDKKIEDEALYSASTMVADCKTQEMIDKTKNTAQLYLCHTDRYLLTVSSSSAELSVLKTIAEDLRLTSLSN